MKIVNLRPDERLGGSVVARFDVELSEDAKLLHWQLKRTGSGHLRVFPPSVRHIGGEGASATLSPELYHAVQAAAFELYTTSKGALAHDVRAV
jgi:hypothetical protein